MFLLFSIAEQKMTVTLLDGTGDTGASPRRTIKAMGIGGVYGWAINASAGGFLQLQVNKDGHEYPRQNENRWMDMQRYVR